MKPPATGARRDRAALALLALATAAWSWSTRTAARPTLETRHVQLGVDPNSAPWWELTALPGIGPSLADRIVEYRSARFEGAPAFREPVDLDAVAGVGPRTLARIARHLRFPPRP